MRAAPLSTALCTLALAGVLVGAAVATDIPSAAVAKKPGPGSEAAPPGRGRDDAHAPNAQAPAPRQGSGPRVAAGPGDAQPVAAAPASTPDPAGKAPKTAGKAAKPGASKAPKTADKAPRTADRTPKRPGKAPSTTDGTPKPRGKAPVQPAPPAQPTPPAAPTTPASQATTTPTPAASTTPVATTPASTSAPRRAHAARSPRKHRTERRSPPRQHSAASRTIAEASSPAPRRTTPRAPQPARTRRQHTTQPPKPRTIQSTIVEVVERLPGWVLAVFLGFAALAAGLAVNAYVSSRRARRLAAQREELVDDVGHLQAALLAPVPSTPDDVSFSVAYRPAAGLAAGGDFYDVFELDAARTAMLLGDVSGHGRESVAQAALVRYTLRTFIAAGHAPAQAIRLTDPCLDGHMDDQFATVVVAIYDHDAHTLTYATAGHHPPLVLGIDAAATAPTSPPIGAGLGGAPTDVTLDVVPGATVCFVTDGLVEARDHGIPIGAERVEELLTDAPDDAEALIAAVAAEADELNDDLAVCLLHRPMDDESPITAQAAVALNA